MYNCYCGATLHVLLLLWGNITCITSIVRLHYMYHCYCRATIHVQLLLWGYITCTTAIVGQHYLYNYYCAAILHVQLLLWGYITSTTAIVGLHYLYNCYCGSTSVVVRGDFARLGFQVSWPHNPAPCQDLDLLYHWEGNAPRKCAAGYCSGAAL